MLYGSPRLSWDVLLKMRKSILHFLAGILLFAGVYVPKAHAVLFSAFVDNAFSTASAGSGAQYDLASVTVFLDPLLTNWVAWNNATSPVIANGSCQGGLCLGSGGFGTDDFIAMTVTNPLGSSLTVNMDQNTAFGNSFGPQNVFFGSVAAAPDAIRTSPSFGSPPPTLRLFSMKPGRTMPFSIWPAIISSVFPGATIPAEPRRQGIRSLMSSGMSIRRPLQLPSLSRGPCF